MRHRILKGLHMEVPDPGLHPAILSTEPPVPPPAGELLHMTSGWGPHPYAQQISNDWFGRSAFVPVPDGRATHASAPGF